jgi:hypothetical protein
MARILDLLFGCRHELSWPRRFFKHGQWKYYQRCLTCGKEVEYTGDLQ